MKIRLGFVSNSSSASFIVAVDKKAKKVMAKIVVEVDLAEYVEKRIKTVEDLDAYRKSEYCGNMADYGKCRKAIESGMDVLILSASDEDRENSVESMLCNMGLKNVVIGDGFVIQGHGGY